MKWYNKFLTSEEQQKIETKITQFEQTTGTELTLCVCRGSDPYPGASLRFSLYAAVVLTVLSSYFISLPEDYMWPVLVFLLTFPMNILGGFNFFKSLTLAQIETNREVDEKALEIFYEHSQSQTTHQNNILIYLSLLEKRLAILIEENLKDKIDQQKLEQFTKQLQAELKMGKNFQGLSHIIDELSQKIQKRIDPDELPPSNNQLKDRILFLDFTH